RVPPPKPGSRRREAQPRQRFPRQEGGGSRGKPGFPRAKSGCPDLNWGPLRPERSALPGCATPRELSQVSSELPGILLGMAERIRVACVQLTSARDKAANLEKADQLVAQAAATGADIVALPEKWNVIGPPDVLHDTAESLDRGESVEAMRGWAKAHGITLVGGSITERREGREKLSNTCLVFDPEGELVATYRKIHLFDVEVGGVVYRESEAEEPGDEPVVADAEDWKLGLSICYDVRFPELYRILTLEGAQLVT